jgi:hypothetical protein
MPDLPNCLDDEHCGFSNLEVMDPGDPQRLPLFPYVLAGTAEGLIAAFLYFLGR